MARIAPTYWAIIAIAAILFHAGFTPAPHFLTEFGMEMGAYNLLMHASFLSFLDYRIANSILGVEWTIPIEVFWYGVLPLILMRVNTRRGFLLWLVFLLVLAALTRVAFGALADSVAAKWFPTTFGAYFLIGAACHRIRAAGWHKVSPWSGAVMWGSVALFVVVLVLAPPGGGAWIGLATAGLLVARKDSAGGGPWLDSVPLRFLGTISYSIYLWHLVVVALLGDAVAEGVLGFALVAAVTVALSTLTYILLERPTNLWGRRVAERIRA
jgi:exopolysaccharide production protein ExoZ